MDESPRIERVFSLRWRIARAIGAVVVRDMARVEFDRDTRPLRALVRIYQDDGTLIEKWIPAETREEARDLLERERVRMFEFGWAAE